MRVALQPGFILHQRPFRDSSLVLEILTQDFGRMGLVARGARSTKSRWRGLLQPFVPLMLSWSGRGELPSLSAAEAAGEAIQMPPERTLSGLYSNELLLRLVARHDPQPALFAYYRDMVRSLAQAHDQEPPLRVFEKQLLAELGYGLILTVEADSDQPVYADRQYCYVPAHGPLPATAGVAAEGVMISGYSLLALAEERLTEPAVLREVKRLNRAAIATQLDDKPLQTRAVVT